MYFEMYEFTDARLKNESNTDRFGIVMDACAACEKLSDEDIEQQLRKQFEVDEKSFAPPLSDNRHGKKLPPPAFYREEARIKQVFPLEAELMLRDPDCAASYDDIMRLYGEDVIVLNGNHLYNGKAAARPEDFDCDDQIDHYLASRSDGEDTAIDSVMTPSQMRIPSSVQLVEQKMYVEWVRDNFPIPIYRELLGGSLAYDLFDLLIKLPQSFAMKFFSLESKDVMTFALIVLRGYKQNAVAAYFQETPAATCRRWDKIIKHLYGKDKKQIKAELKRKCEERKAYEKYINRVKREVAAEKKAEKEPRKLKRKQKKRPKSSRSVP